MMDSADNFEEWQHLLKYGYAPGGYMCRCSVCKELQYDLDKRASTCKPCAQALYDRDQEDVMDEKLPEKKIVKFKYFATSEEFEQWQQDNDVTILTLGPVVGGFNAGFSCTGMMTPDVADYYHVVFVTYHAN